MRRLRGFGLRCLRLGVGGLRGGFERRLAVERRPAEAAERQQRPAEHSEAENDADRGHHPLRDGVDIAALRGLRRVGAVLRRDSRAGTQALAGIAAGGAGAAGLLPQTLAGGGLFGPRGGVWLRGLDFFRFIFCGGAHALRLRLGGGLLAAGRPAAKRALAQTRVIGRAAVFTVSQFHKNLRCRSARQTAGGLLANVQT